MIKQGHILRFENFSQFNSLIHGFSTRYFGSMRPSRPGYQDSFKKFTHALSLVPQQLVRMNQIHSNNVFVAIENDCGHVITQTDGLVTEEKNVFLGVITADCVPLLFYDPKTNFSAAVHAGWRGLYAEIIKEAVSQMVAKGSDPQNIIVGIGPSIRVCCYEVNEEFIENFCEKFESVENFVERRDGKIYFNLQKITKKQLEDAGVLEKNIEDGDYCTFTLEDVYSCRREGEDFGEIMGIIGLRNE